MAESYEISFPQKVYRTISKTCSERKINKNKAVILLQPPFNNPDINLPSLEFILYYTHDTQVMVFQEHSVRNNARRAESSPPPPPPRYVRRFLSLPFISSTVWCWFFRCPW